MKNKFLAGLLIGLVCGAFLFFQASLLMGQIKFPMISEINTSDVGTDGTQDSDETAKTTENKMISQKEIDNKIKLLEGYIDKYYLEAVDKNAFADGIYKGLLASLKDPYSTYYTAKEYSALKEASTGKYVGIGATVSQDKDSGIISIVKPFVDSPAYQAGILPGDILYKVDGKEVTGEDLSEVVTMLKGKEGTTVEVHVVRDKEIEPIVFTIKRKKIEVPTITYEMMDDQIGYIAIGEFDEVTAEQFRKALNDLEKQGEKALVIDLRNNGGGRLDAVVDMLDRMLPKGMIVSTRDKNGEGEKFTSSDKEKFNKPLTVLINGNSASASEIFAGAIQDYKLGTLVGTKSFGKGIVQSVIPLKDGTAIKLTTSKYYTPNGRNIHGTGIEPDVMIELDESLKQKVVIEKKDDNQLQKAIEIIKQKIK